MKALLLSAGIGSRLRPLTLKTPKCLVPINNKPLLQYWLEQLEKIGVKEFIINTHYLHDQVQDFIKKSKFSERITVIYEDELLGTGGTLKKMLKYLKITRFFLFMQTISASQILKVLYKVTILGCLTSLFQ